jgi:translation elongation factor EF-4
MPSVRTPSLLFLVAVSLFRVAVVIISNPSVFPEPLVIDLNKPIIRLSDEFYSVVLDLVEQKSAAHTAEEMLKKARCSLEAAHAEAVPGVIGSLRNGMRGPVLATDLSAEKMCFYMFLVAEINGE